MIKLQGTPCRIWRQLEIGLAFSASNWPNWWLWTEPNWAKPSSCRKIWLKTTGGRSSSFNWRGKLWKRLVAEAKDSDSLDKMTKSAFLSTTATHVRLGRPYNRDDQARVFGRQLTAEANRAQNCEKTPRRRVSKG